MKDILAALIIALGSLAPCARAADSGYPERPVRVIVGYPSGDTSELIARIAAQALTETFKRGFTVESHPGANGTLASGRVAKAKAGGYTLLLASSSFAANVGLYPNLGHHPLRDFVGLTRIANVHNVLVVNSSLGIKTLADFIAAVRSSPGKMTIASGGTGSMSHLAIELMKVRAGPLNMLHVPYKGSGPAIAELLGQQVDALFVTMPYAFPHIRSGRIRALAVASLKRAAPLPEVPTFDEMGVRGFDATAWNALVAPAGTPYDAIVRLNLGWTKVAGSPAYKQKLDALGAEVANDTPEQFAEYLRSEIAKWEKIVKAASITVD